MIAPRHTSRWIRVASGKGFASAIGLVLLPQAAWASDYSGLLPFYIAFVMLIGGLVAGLEWAVINSIAERRAENAAGDDGEEAGEDTDAPKKSRFGCGFAIGLWLANSLFVHIVILAIWG